MGRCLRCEQNKAEAGPRRQQLLSSTRRAPVGPAARMELGTGSRITTLLGRTPAAGSANGEYTSLTREHPPQGKKVIAVEVIPDVNGNVLAWLCRPWEDNPS